MSVDWNAQAQFEEGPSMQTCTKKACAQEKLYEMLNQFDEGRGLSLIDIRHLSKYLVFSPIFDSKSDRKSASVGFASFDIAFKE